MYSVMKRLLIGSPLASEALGEQRLNKRVALAVFGTDAIASTAFASQEILVVLVPVAGMAALDYLVPISLVVIALLVIVTASYRQTLYAYPSGGGSYIVSRENLGTRDVARRGRGADGRLHADRRRCRSRPASRPSPRRSRRCAATRSRSPSSSSG